MVIREVAARELTELKTGSGVIRAGGFFGRGECAEPDVYPMDNDVRAPSIQNGGDALEAAGGTRQAICPIQEGFTDTNVRSTVVESVAVPMIDFLVISGLRKEPMQVNTFSRPARTLDSRLGIPSVARLPGVPIVDADKVSILAVDNRKLSLGERNQDRGSARVLEIRDQRSTDEMNALSARAAALRATARRNSAIDTGSAKLMGHVEDLHNRSIRGAEPGADDSLSPGFFVPELYQVEG